MAIIKDSHGIPKHVVYLRFQRRVKGEYTVVDKAFVDQIQLVPLYTGGCLSDLRQCIALIFPEHVTEFEGTEEVPLVERLMNKISDLHQEIQRLGGDITPFMNPEEDK